MPKKSSSNTIRIPKILRIPEIFLGMCIGRGITLTVLECIRQRIFEKIIYFLGFQNESTPLIRGNLNECEYEAIDKLFPKIANDIALTREQADTACYISEGLIAAVFTFQILKNILNVCIGKISDTRSREAISYVDGQEQTYELASSTTETEPQQIEDLNNHEQDNYSTPNSDITEALANPTCYKANMSV